MYMYRCLREIGLNLDCMHQFYHTSYITACICMRFLYIQWTYKYPMKIYCIRSHHLDFTYNYTFTDQYITSSHTPCYHCMLRYECTYCMMFYTCLVNNILHRVNVRSSIQNMSCYFLAAQNFKVKFISCNDISNNLMA